MNGSGGVSPCIALFGIFEAYWDCLGYDGLESSPAACSLLPREHDACPSFVLEVSRGLSVLLSTYTGLD